MIAILNGKLIYKSPTEIIVNCGGVGYSVMVPVSTSESLPAAGEIIKIYTILIPKEDALQLFGFATGAEKETFKLLISISGIGPKMAIGILSSVSVAELQNYVLNGNLIALQKLPNIGKKTAERLVLELRDKIIKIGISTEGIPIASAATLVKQEAVAALVTLGYSRLIAEKSVQKAISEEPSAILTAEKLIRKSLKFVIN